MLITHSWTQHFSNLCTLAGNRNEFENCYFLLVHFSSFLNAFKYPILLFSSYVLSMTALDRFLVCFCNISFKFYSCSWFGFQLEFQAICFPLTNLVWISRKQHIMIAIAWIVSIILCIPQVRITIGCGFGSSLYKKLCYQHLKVELTRNHSLSHLALK